MDSHTPHTRRPAHRLRPAMAPRAQTGSWGGGALATMVVGRPAVTSVVVRGAACRFADACGCRFHCANQPCSPINLRAQHSIDVLFSKENELEHSGMAEPRCCVVCMRAQCQVQVEHAGLRSCSAPCKVISSTEKTTNQRMRNTGGQQSSLRSYLGCILMREPIAGRGRQGHSHHLRSKTMS